MTEANSKPDGHPKRPSLLQRQYIVNKPFQHRLIGTLMSIWLANCVFFTVVFYFYEGHLEQFYTLVPQPGMRPLLTPSMLFTLAMVFVYVFGFIVLLIIALYMSNQIAGPLYRTKLSMERVGRGDFGVHLQFRQGDFLRDIPGVFNAMVDALRQQAEMDAELVRALEEASNNPAELKRLLREFRKRKEAREGLEARDRDSAAPQPVTLAIS